MTHFSATWIISDDTLDSIVQDARRKAAGSAWLTSLETAYAILLEMDSIRYDPRTLEVEVPSASNEGTTYTATGEHCTCLGHRTGGRCWHRAAARLVALAIEAEANAAQQALAARVDARYADLFKDEDEDAEARAQRIARKRSSVPVRRPTAYERTGVTREEAYRRMEELFA